MSEQAAFGSRLRQERERRDISLAAVSESTKIAQSLLAALERGDASGWPPGIYRRAFLRVYATAIGLAPDAIVAEFSRLFPECDPAAAPRVEMPEPGALRLTLAQARAWSIRTLAFQAAAAAIDAGFVLAASAGLNTLMGTANWTTAAIFAVAYYSVATAALGRSPALWALTAAHDRQTERNSARAPQRPNSRELLHIVTTPPRVRPQVEEDFEVEDQRIASR